MMHKISVILIMIMIIIIMIIIITKIEIITIIIMIKIIKLHIQGKIKNQIFIYQIGKIINTVWIKMK